MPENYSEISLKINAASQCSTHNMAIQAGCENGWLECCLEDQRVFILVLVHPSRLACEVLCYTMG